MDLSVFEQAGLTQGEAAERIGVARLTFIRWLKGAKPGPQMAPQIKRAVVLAQVAMKLGLLGDHLAPPRRNQELRRQQIDDAFAKAEQAVKKLKARKAAG